VVTTQSPCPPAPEKESMIETVITENSSEKLTVKWDGTRFAIVLSRKNNDAGLTKSVILLNPIEAMTLLEFLASCGKEE